MAMMLIALLVALLPPLQTGATPTVSSMQTDVDRLVRAAETLTGTWPSQPPRIPEVAGIFFLGYGACSLDPGRGGRRRRSPGDVAHVSRAA